MDADDGGSRRLLSTSTTIYANGALASGWQDFSYGGSVSFQSTNDLLGSNRYIRAQLSAFGSLSLKAASPLAASGRSISVTLAAASPTVLQLQLQTQVRTYRI